jgi:3-dehydroquinate dehydratase
VNVTVFAPPSTELPALPAGADVVRYATARELVAGLREGMRAVIVTDGLSGGDAVAHAIRTLGASAIEVQSQRWDGETHSELTAACRGVIAGFGAGAVAYAVGVFGAA